MVMDSQNSQDFSYAKLKSWNQQTIVGVSGNNKFAITLIPINKCTIFHVMLLKHFGVVSWIGTNIFFRYILFSSFRIYNYTT